jgi:phenylalanyl-tRNA synthetase beta chain
MKIALSWLSDFMEINRSVDEYVDMLNQLGLEVEGVEQPGKDISGLVIVRVLGTHPHPDADKLKLVDIDTGKDKRTIVCGAPNVREGLTVAYAPSGATLPGGFTLSKKKIRGVESDGMLCSGKELGIGDDHSGILELDNDAPIGTDAAEYLGLNDTIIELSITPNRPDAMSVVGVARELCAAFNQELKLPDFSSFLSNVAFDESLPKPEVTVENMEKCPRFVGRTASVSMGQSPLWMQQRLTKAGMRPISNVVDVTNYVLLEWGRPLHAFDLDKLGSAHIVVRTAQPSEKMITLDGAERELTEDDLVIADEKRVPQAIAGIMGGADSEVSDSTTKIYLESAYFQAETISRSSKRLGLRSEASSRFERGVDPAFTAYGSHRALQLLDEIADAKISSVEVDFYPAEIKEVSIELRTSRVERLLGDALTGDEIETLLAPLVSSIERTDSGVKVKAPTYRPDLTREIDLIEEVARRRGLNSFEATLPNSLAQVGGLSRNQKRRRNIEDALCGAGLSEAYSMPLESFETFSDAMIDPELLVHTKNALKADASVLRPVIVPGLIRSVRKNIARGISNVSLFETGKVFQQPFDENFQPHEELHLAFVMTGRVDARPHSGVRDIDVFDATDVLHVVTDTLRLHRPELIDNAGGHYHPTRSAKIVIDGVEVGVIGQIVAEENIVACEVNLDALFEIPERDMEYVPQSNQPFVAFDLALVVDSDVSVSALKNSLKKHGGQELESLSCFDIYQGTVGDNKKSLAFALRVRPQENTWNESDVQSYREKILAGVNKDTGATLRS